MHGRVAIKILKTTANAIPDFEVQSIAALAF
jgi:hypothetical protein